jgi:hypothetical protein
VHRRMKAVPGAALPPAILCNIAARRDAHTPPNPSAPRAAPEDQSTLLQSIRASPSVPRRRRMVVPRLQRKAAGRSTRHRSYTADQKHRPAAAEAQQSWNAAVAAAGSVSATEPWQLFRGHTVMKTIGLGLFVFATLCVSMMGMNAAQAAPFVVSSQLGATANRLSPIERTQFSYEGREYCWSDNGWNGPGWYWCGYESRQGFGYGGPEGWHDWHNPSGPPLHGPGSSHDPRPAPVGSPNPNPVGSPGNPIFCGSQSHPKPGCPGSGHPPPPKNIHHLPGGIHPPPVPGGGRHR